MGDYRKTALRRMKDAEVEWRKWHKVVAKDAKSMVGDMLVELDNRHQILLSEFSAAGQRRDAVARDMAGIQKEVQSVQKAMTRGNVLMMPIMTGTVCSTAMTLIVRVPKLARKK